MGVPSMQQPTPSPTHTLVPRIVTPPRAANQQNQTADMFLDMLQGPAITVAVGSATPPRRYTLPNALLCSQSIFFRTATTHLKGLMDTPSKNRKFEAEEDVKLPLTNETNTAEGIEVMKTDFVIELPDIDPAIFGLFLSYIYKGAYSKEVDQSGGLYQAAHPSPYARSPNSTTINPIPPQAPLRMHLPLLPRTPRHEPSLSKIHLPTPIPTGPTSQSDSIPPSIHAWLLAQHLGSIPFMNHAITHVFHSVGTYFALTPSLIHYVWARTTPFTPTAQATDGKVDGEVDVDGFTLHLTLNRFCANITPNPLRKLLLDVLIVHWPLQTLRIIDYSCDWNVLFDAHPDLRRAFIYGLQGGVKLMALQGYFAAMKK